jgi:1-acyl-sn-glycerol-3-phosphate acyltransferase
MRTLLAIGRLAAVAALTGAFYLLWLTSSLVTWPWPRARIRCRNFSFRHWARSILWAMGARVSIGGVPPRAPFFLVSNHLSYVDIMILASQVDGVFIAKSEVATWPVVGLLCRSIGTLFVDRNAHRDLPRVLAEIERILGQRQGVILFPEGTSTAGADVGAFRPSLLEAAARGGLDVSYASLSYKTPSEHNPAHLTVCWWGDMGFADHFFKLLTLRGFEATVSFGAETVRHSDRKLLAAQLELAVRRLFVPVVDRPLGPDPA